jgi:RNA recognition motif-containing protein
VRLQAQSKKDTERDEIDPTALSKTKRKRQDKVKQTLSIRVFGLNYSTTEQDVKDFFQHCGKIVEITFPTYVDSGRSKGYCGILFASPKAVQKAVQEMNGTELHGRWLSVQEGKMFLRKWEEGERARKEEGRGGRVENEHEIHKEQPLVGEFGQKVKKRKKHGFSD